MIHNALAFGTILFGVLLAQSGSIAANVLEIKIRQDMLYRQARTVLTRSGWQKPRLPAYGHSKTDQKVISECFGSVALCNAFPEIENCSGTGYCRMRYNDHFGNTLIVITYGDLRRNAYVMRWWLEK